MSRTLDEILVSLKTLGLHLISREKAEAFGVVESILWRYCQLLYAELRLESSGLSYSSSRSASVTG